MKQGVLISSPTSDRCDIRFGLDDYYEGLHCGTCFDAMVNGKWVPTRIEKSDRWYLVGVRTKEINGLRVRCNWA